MFGAPGVGKSMLAQRLPGILPPLTPWEVLEVSQIHSLAGELPEGGIRHERPFRSPHHTASQAAIAGGGMKANPGEVSLAHKGVLFLDEFPEFARTPLEALRQPLETGEVTVARANKHVTYPARFQLIAAMNPCKCGYLDNPALCCHRAPLCAAEYQNKISGPLMDRIDLHIDVGSVSPWDLSTTTRGESSSDVKARVLKARQIQLDRYQKLGQKISCNADADGQILEKILCLGNQTQPLLQSAAEKFHLSARGYHRILKVARTIADMEGSEQVLMPHMSEALSYRRLMPGKK